jgi:MFS family permease
MTRTHANIKKLYFFSFLKMSLFPMAIITLYWKDQVGLSLSQILFLQAIYSVAMVIMEYPSGYISDRIGYRAALNLASLLGIIGWTLYTLASSFALVLVAEIILGFSFSFISGTDSALLYESIKDSGEKESYPRHEGRVSGVGQIGEACGAIFAGLLYATAPLLPFFIQIAVWILALQLCRTLKEPKRERTSPKNHLVEAYRLSHHTFIENGLLRQIIFLNVVLGLASFYPVWLVQPYMQDGGVPLAWFGPIWAGANLSVAIASILSHRCRRSLGDKKMVLLFLLLTVSGYLGLGLTGGLWGFLFYYLLTIMRGFRVPLFLNHIQQEIPSANRAAILSLQSLSFRLSFVCTAPLVGVLADSVGVQKTFLILSLFFALALPPISWFFIKRLRIKKLTHHPGPEQT